MFGRLFGSGATGGVVGVAGLVHRRLAAVVGAGRRLHRRFVLTFIADLRCRQVGTGPSRRRLVVERLGGRRLEQRRRRAKRRLQRRRRQLWRRRRLGELVVMGIRRICRHLLAASLAGAAGVPAARARRASSRRSRRGEATHSGQVRFVVEGALDGAPLFRNQPARERALDVFAQLRIWDTADNNGVLIYLLLADRDVEIIADRGIDAKVGARAGRKSAARWRPISGPAFRARRDRGHRGGVAAAGAHFPPGARTERTAGCAGGDVTDGDVDGAGVNRARR